MALCEKFEQGDRIEAYYDIPYPYTLDLEKELKLSISSDDRSKIYELNDLKGKNIDSKTANTLAKDVYKYACETSVVAAALLYEALFSVIGDVLLLKDHLDKIRDYVCVAADSSSLRLIKEALKVLSKAELQSGNNVRSVQIDDFIRERYENF